jgi:hypothetical protein
MSSDPRVIEGPIPGKQTSTLKLYRIGPDDALIEPRVAEASTLAELDAVRRRADWRYQVVAGRKRLTPEELARLRALEAGAP